MQTIYTTSSRLGVRVNNVIDLNEYRRSLGLAQEEPAEQLEMSPLLWAQERPSSVQYSGRRHRAANVSAWLLDIMASAGVVAMTAAFTLQML